METEYFFSAGLFVYCLFDLANCRQLVCLLALQGEMELDFSYNYSL